MPTNNENYAEKIAGLKNAIKAEQAILNDLVETAMKEGRPIASPEVLAQNAKVSDIISDYNDLINNK